MKKLLVLAPYAVVPPRYGGPLRIFNLCRELSRHYDVRQFAQQAQRSQLRVSISPVVQQVTPTYTEFSSRNPVSLALYALTSLRWNCPPTWQGSVLRIAAPKWLRRQIRDADLILVEHPWQFAWAYRQVGKSKPLVLMAHNVECQLYTRAHITAPHPLGQAIVRAIGRQERFATAHATRIITVSEDDAATLATCYGVARDRFITVPSGVDCTQLAPASQAQRAQRKHELGLDGKQVVLFAGSMHRPNVEAVQRIVRWAEDWTDDQICFLIVGTVGRGFAHVRHPRLRFTGSVVTTKPYFEAADVAINPMLAGSGTNLKQLEFMAMGVPTLATPIGARGIPITSGVEGYVESDSSFPTRIRWMLEHPEIQAQVGAEGRQFVERRFDWPVVGAKLIQTCDELMRA